MGQWVTDKVRQYNIRDARSFLAAYEAISAELYVSFGDPEGRHLLTDECERERNLLQRVREIAAWRSADDTDRNGQMYLFASEAPSPSADPLFMARVRRDTGARGDSDVARLAAAMERGDWEWIVARIWSYRRSAAADRAREEASVMVDDMPAFADSDELSAVDVVDRAERLFARGKYYEHERDELSAVDDSIDAERLYERFEDLFEEFGVEREDAVRLIGYAQSLARTKLCDAEDVLRDNRFREFLGAIQEQVTGESAMAA